jgi:hypothetical protein
MLLLKLSVGVHVHTTKNQSRLLLTFREDTLEKEVALEKNTPNMHLLGLRVITGKNYINAGEVCHISVLHKKSIQTVHFILLWKRYTFLLHF